MIYSSSTQSVIDLKYSMTYFIFFFQNRSAVSGRFRDGFGCPRTKIRPRKTKDLCAIVESIWASDLQHNLQLSKASGHQSSKIPP